MNRMNRDQAHSPSSVRIAWPLFVMVYLVYLLFAGQTFEGYGQDTMDASGALVHWIAGREAPTRLAPQGFFVEPLLGVPFYAAGAALDALTGRPEVDALKVFTWNMYLTLQAALAVVLVYTLAARIYRSRFTALVVALVYALGTMTFAYSGLGHETMLCLTMLISLWASHRLADDPRWRNVLLAGIAAGATAATKSYGVLFLPFLAAFFALMLNANPTRPPLVRRALAFLACIVPFAVVNLFYVRRILTAGGGLPGGFFDWEVQRIPLALVGMYWSAGKGFFIYNLPLLLAIPLAGAFWRSHRREAIAFLFCIITWSLFVAGFTPPLPFADEMWGARYLYPLIPLFALAMGGLVQKGAIGAVYAILAAVSTAASALSQLLSRLWPKSYVTNVFSENIWINNCETWQYVPAYSPIRLRLYILWSHIIGRAVMLDYSPEVMNHHRLAGVDPPVWELAVSPERFPIGVWWHAYLARLIRGETSARVVVAVAAAGAIAAGACIAGVVLARNAKLLERQS